MKRLSFFALPLLVIASSVNSCSNGTYHAVKRLADYVYEVPTYTSLDENYANEYFLNNYNNWTNPKQGGGCSAIYKRINDDAVLVGRNMDLNISNKCAYIVRTNVPGKHKTVGLAYTFRDISPDQDLLIKNNGIEDKFYKLLPFMCDDIINDAGLHIEINMRTGEYATDGSDKFACSGTNPNLSNKVYMFELIRFIAENCATVGEAEKYVHEQVNVYSKKYYWNYAFLISDIKGGNALLEFAHDMKSDKDEIFFLHPSDEFKHCQTNFYVNKTSSLYEDILSGKGRYDYLIEHIESVTNEKEMYQLMKDVSYYQVYDPYNCKFDPRSENIGVVPYATKDIVLNDKFKDFIFQNMDATGKQVRALSRKEQQNLNCFWESSFTEVVNIVKKEIFVRFFENDNCTMRIKLDETIPDNL
ncbi:MAG: linear amide C-N hydrolase [Bacilli bacterium]|nr:linear amide C-N hydrolase [Bacilli bacterium]